MAEQKNRWTWDVPGFESRSSFDREETAVGTHTMLRRLSVSPSTLAPRSELLRPAVTAKLQTLEKQVKVCCCVNLEIAKITASIELASVMSLSIDANLVT